MPKKGVDSNYLINNMSHKIHQQNLFYLKLVLLVQSVTTKVGHQQTTPITNGQHGMTDTTQEQNYVLTTINVEGLYLVMISKQYFVVTKAWKTVENNCKNGEINYKKLKVLRSCSPDYFWLEGESKLTISARVEPYSGVRGNQVPYYDYHYHCNCYFYRYHQRSFQNHFTTIVIKSISAVIWSLKQAKVCWTNL